MIDIGQGDAGFLQAIADCRRRKASGVLDAIETLFFHRRNEFAVTNKRSGSVAVVGVDSENIHFGLLAYLTVTECRCIESGSTNLNAVGTIR